MIDEQRQRISAFQDGELDTAGTARLIDAVTVDSELRGAWERYHLIGLAIRNEPIDLARCGIADAVRERLAHEPTILAPGRLKPDRHPRVAPYAGVALAAAAAFLAVLVVPDWRDVGSSLWGRGGSLPAVAQAPAPAPEPVKRWELDRPELANKLDLFLVTHQETAPVTGAKGLLPYATFVGYEAGR